MKFCGNCKKNRGNENSPLTKPKTCDIIRMQIEGGIDKYDYYCCLAWGQWSQLRRDLVKDVEKSPALPEEAEKIYEISDTETDELLVRVDGNI